MSSSVAARLRNQTQFLVNSFEGRISALKNRSDIMALIKAFDQKDAVMTLRDLFGEGRHFAVGIDGSMDYDERLEMLLFYVSCTGFRCFFEVGDELKFDLKRCERDSRLSVSASVPLWVEDISDVLNLAAAETDFDFQKAMERIPYALMTMGELYLALRAARSDDVRIIFMDRPLSATFAPLSRDLRLLLRRERTVLTEVENEFGRASKLDLTLASVLGSGRIYVPPRGRYLKYAVIRELLSNSEGFMTRQELADRFRLEDKILRKVVKQLVELDAKQNSRLFEHCDLTALELKKDVKDYWRRVLATSLKLVERNFYGEEHPLQLNRDSWLSILDLNSINLFLVYALLDEVLKKGVLLIGIAKDTTATDLTRSIIPYSTIIDLLRLESSLPNLKNDRAFLTIFSAVNSDKIRTPWRSLAYDTCFTTLMENRDGKPALMAARKVIFREELFVRAYFQLRSFSDDPSVRSSLFLYDRPYYLKYDNELSREVSALEWSGESLIHPFFEGSDSSRVDDLILYILSRCDNPEVIEAYGHNQLLYLADKAVKAEVKAMKGLLRGVADLQLGTLTRRNRVFTIVRRFRDLRASSESARSRAAQRWDIH